MRALSHDWSAEVRQEGTILFAKNTSGGKLKGSTRSLDELSFDHHIASPSNSIAEPFSRLQLND